MTDEATSPTSGHNLPGVLLVNLGTPDAPTVPALRRYLAEFLSDPDVVTLPRFFWLPLLHLLVLRTRPAKSAEAYARIWGKEGSPLLVNSRALEAKLQMALCQRFGKPVLLALGMRYGNPAIGEALEVLRREGATRLLVLPLYPQYAAATTASSSRAIARTLERLGWSPRVRIGCRRSLRRPVHCHGRGIGEAPAPGCKPMAAHVPVPFRQGALA